MPLMLQKNRRIGGCKQMCREKRAKRKTKQCTRDTFPARGSSLLPPRSRSDAAPAAPAEVPSSSTGIGFPSRSASRVRSSASLICQHEGGKW